MWSVEGLMLSSVLINQHFCFSYNAHIDNIFLFIIYQPSYLRVQICEFILNSEFFSHLISGNVMISNLIGNPKHSSLLMMELLHSQNIILCKICCSDLDTIRQGYQYNTIFYNILKEIFFKSNVPAGDFYLLMQYRIN